MPGRNWSASPSKVRRRPPAPCRTAFQSVSASTPPLTPIVNTSASAVCTAYPAQLCTSLATEPAPIGPT